MANALKYAVAPGTLRSGLYTWTFPIRGPKLEFGHL